MGLLYLFSLLRLHVARACRIFQDLKLSLIVKIVVMCTTCVYLLIMQGSAHTKRGEGTNCRRAVDEHVWKVSLTKDGSAIDVKKIVYPLNIAYVMGVNKWELAETESLVNALFEAVMCLT